MLNNIGEFAEYYANVRRRTMKYVRSIPPNQLEWSPDAGEYACRDIVRHIEAAEKMYMTLLTTSRWRYPGHAGAEQLTLPDLIAQMESRHADALATLRACSNPVLYEMRPSFVDDAPSVKVWRWLMAMVEHEVHHRSQLATYLHLLGIAPPQIFGVTVEDLIARAVE